VSLKLGIDDEVPSGLDRAKVRTLIENASTLPSAMRSSPCSAAAATISAPAELYSPSSRPYTGLPELDYPLHDRQYLVTACGRICMHRKKINLSTVLAGQKVGLKEVDEGIWLVSFMHYDLGYIDLEQRTLQPLDNPFGTRLSPMS